MKYLLVSTTGVLHMDPAREECNIDQVSRRDRHRFADEASAKADPAFKRLCRHCWPAYVANPEPAEAPASASVDNLAQPPLP